MPPGRAGTAKPTPPTCDKARQNVRSERHRIGCQLIQNERVTMVVELRSANDRGAERLAQDEAHTLETTPHWPEPDVPDDLSEALATAAPKITDIWNDITPMARWEWVR
jgi:hypothetical protein